MKKGSINPYDLLTLTLIILLTLTVVLHIILPSDEVPRQTAKIEIRTEKLKALGSLPKTVTADGRFVFEVLGQEKEMLYLACICFRHNAGIMSVGGKLLCPNQPIAFTGEGFYAEGRISRIEAF